MAFNIRSGAGWLRLWVLCCIVWAVVVVVITSDGFPTKAGLDSNLEFQLSLISPDANKRRADIWGYPPLAPAVVAQRKAEAVAEHREGVDNLERDQRRHLIRSALFWFVPSLLLLISGWLIGWVVRGFTRPSA